MPQEQVIPTATAVPELTWNLAPGTSTRVLQNQKGEAQALLVKNDCGWTAYLVVNGRAELTNYRCMPSFYASLSIIKHMVVKRMEEQLNKI